MRPELFHPGRQGPGLKHVQGSYQLTVIQASVSPHDDSSADVASVGREGGSTPGRGRGGGLEPVYFPAAIPPQPSAPCQQGQHRHGEREVEELSAAVAQPPARGAPRPGSAAIWVLFNIPPPVSPALWPICPADGEVCRQGMLFSQV